jgi:hypothetical protein
LLPPEKPFARVFSRANGRLLRLNSDTAGAAS